MESSNISLAVAVLILAITYIYYYCHKKLTYWSSRGIEQLPTPHWLFGNFKEGILFRASPGWHLGQLYKRARHDAPYVGFYIFQKPCFLLKDPKIIRHILVRDFNKFPNRYFAGNNQKDSIGMRNLFAVRGKEWGYMRCKIVPLLTKSMKRMLPLMTRAGEPMLRYIERNEGRRLDVQDLSFKYASDLIASVGLGTTTDSFGNPDGEFTRHLSAFFYSFRRMVALVSVFFVPDVVNWTGSLLLFSTKFIRTMFWVAMEERQKSGEERGDFIDVAKKLQDEPQNPLYEFCGDNLVHQAGTFFSGFESSAAAATFTLLELARHPAHQEQARTDIRQAIQKHGWKNEAFRDMGFLQLCMREAIRMHPQVSTLDRVGGEDYKVVQIPGTDITIEKGTAMYISIYGLHEDPQYFEDPGIFDPFRLHKSPEAYLPFGAGPRMCPGSTIGLLHAKVVICLILANYELHQNLEERLILDPRSTFTSADGGLNLQFRKLSDEKRIQLPSYL